MGVMDGYTDEDFRRSVTGAIRMRVIATAVATPVVWWKLGWGGAALLVVGAAISGSGLYEWLRLMTTVMTHMDVGGEARPMGPVMTGFFLRLGVSVGVLYVSLRYLNGSVWALAAGLTLGVFALAIEGLRLMRAWTV